jgi:hypothetical protein
MGTLKPNATYIYERVDNQVYVREQGSDPNTRQLMGYAYDPVNGHHIDYDARTSDGRPLVEHIREDKMWGEIRRMAKTNPALHAALERAKIIYYLSKEHGDSKT